MSKMMHILGHEAVLVITVASIAGTNVGVIEKVPDLVIRLESRELSLQSVLNALALIVPRLNLSRSGEGQLHEALQL